jgi:hypothetical protein
VLAVLFGCIGYGGRYSTGSIFDLKMQSYDQLLVVLVTCLLAVGLS